MQSAPGLCNPCHQGAGHPCWAVQSFSMHGPGCPEFFHAWPRPSRVFHAWPRPSRVFHAWPRPSRVFHAWPRPSRVFHAWPWITRLITDKTNCCIVYYSKRVCYKAVQSCNHLTTLTTLFCLSGTTFTLPGLLCLITFSLLRL